MAEHPRPVEFHVTLRDGQRVRAHGTRYSLDSSSGFLTIQPDGEAFVSVFRMADVLYFSGPHAADDGKDIDPVPAKVEPTPHPLP
jgi:hypothetical protein